MDDKHITSGIFETLRARCSSCGEAIARHAFCASCGVPRRCGDERAWQAGKKLRCPDCATAATA